MTIPLQPPPARVSGTGTVRRADGSVKRDTPKPNEERNDGTVSRREHPHRPL